MRRLVQSHFAIAVALDVLLGIPLAIGVCSAVSPVSEATAALSLPAGTVLYIRLETPINSTSSKVHQKVSAEVIRQSFVGGKVAVPLGAKLTGEITKLHASANPNDPALMTIDFTQLQIPEENSVKISCHISDVENARETIFKNGTIQGVVAKDLGSSYVDNAVAKLTQQGGVLGSLLSNFQKTMVGTPDTAIDYPKGTDMQVTLDKPLSLEKTFPPAAAQELPASELDAVRQVLAKAPQRSSTQNGTPGDPINLVIVGGEQEIRQAFQQAGWEIPAVKQSQSVAKTVQAVVQGRGYGVAPISNLYIDRRPQDLAFEKTLNTFAKRHHVRFWRATAEAPGRVPIWLGAAVHDTGFDIHPGVVSHATSPNLDKERAKVGADLLASGFVSAEQLVTPPKPLHQGLTGTGGPWETDGKLLVIALKPH